MLSGRFNLPLLLFAAITLVSFFVRWWYFRNTVGLLYGVGTEEAFRLSYITSAEGTAFFIGPFHAWVGRLLHLLFPDVIYITRWMSLFFGVLTPGLLFFSFYRRHFFSALFAGFALVLSPSHITLSTIGTAESLSFLLLFLCLFFLDRAWAAHEAYHDEQSKWMSLLSALCYGAVMLTRFETWVLIPFLAIFVFVYFRRQWLWWLPAILAPLYWLIKSRVIKGSFFASTSLIPQFSKAEAFENLSITSSLVENYTGMPVVLLAVFGAGWLLTRRNLRPLAVCGVTIVAFMLFMMRQGKINSDPKYADNIVTWLYVFFGVGIGVLVHLIGKRMGVVIHSMKNEFLIKEKRRLILCVLLGALVIVNLTLPTLIDYTKERFWREKEPFSNFQPFFAVLSDINQNAPVRFRRIYLMTSHYHQYYSRVYKPPELANYISHQTWEKDVKVTKLTEQLVKTIAKKGQPSISLVVTEPYSVNAPIDDLAVEQTINGLHLQRVLVWKKFRVYQVE